MAVLRCFLMLLVVLLSACATSVRKFPIADPMTEDPDRRPFVAELEVYYSPFVWDAANQMIFRPVSRALYVEVETEAQNVNSIDEVPNSSRVTNRLGKERMSTEEFVRAGCGDGPTLPEDEKWTVVGAKPNGANPGFFVKSAAGVTFMVKFDGTLQPERATTADVVGSILYWNAGFFAPCNRVVFMSEDTLVVPDGMMYKKDGKKLPLTMDIVRAALKQSTQLEDGRVRASASRFVDGKPIGPWTYNDTRSDDPNDVIDHEHRRELRGGKMLAAWVNHFDAREQNTMAAFIKTDEAKGAGYVRHYYIDFGDGFGSDWEIDGITKRLGHSGYFSPGHIFADWLSFGIVDRPWHRPQSGPTGIRMNYYNVDQFEPEAWMPGYPNPAFSNMTERDGAWMARILGRITPAHIDAAVDAARIENTTMDRELRIVLKGRLRKILFRYYTRLSPLTDFRIESGELCGEDLALATGLADAKESLYRVGAASVSEDGDLRQISIPTTRRHEGAKVCFPLPAVSGPSYLVYEIRTQRGSIDQQERPIWVHLSVDESSAKVIGLERFEFVREQS